MIVSQPAILCLAATFHRLLGRTCSDATVVSTSVGTRPRTTAATHHSNALEPSPPAVLEHIEAPDYAPMSVIIAAADAPLSADELRARAAALRALALARGRRFESSRAAFTEAARLDPALDLTRTPGFWRLERSAHEAAIDAYIMADRDGDAAILRARVRSTYRPKPIRQHSRVAASL